MSPVVVMETTREYLERVATWDATWDEGLESGDVRMTGSPAAWGRMLAITGDPSRRRLLGETTTRPDSVE